MSTKAYIALGSNIGDSVATVEQATNRLATLSVDNLPLSSSLYRSAPMGPQDQSNFINSVICLSTNLDPLVLLDELQTIEHSFGRERKEQRWGPRTLDLDILLYGDKTIDHARLKVPHYGMSERNFVLLPLYEIAPDLILPDGKTLSSMVEAISHKGIEKLA